MLLSDTRMASGAEAEAARKIQGRRMVDKRYRQADREALYTLALYVFFFAWWFVFAFGLGSGDPEDYAYIWGIPAWFFYSCILGYPLICLLLWGVLRLFFRIMPLDEEEHGLPPGSDGGTPFPACSLSCGGKSGAEGVSQMPEGQKSEAGRHA